MAVNTTNRKTHLDTLKAIACILVVLGHAFSYYDERVQVLPLFWKTVSILVYAVHVPLFFTIAGYLCHRQPLAAYAKKKVFRVLIPFLTFTVLKLLYSRFFDSGFSHQAGFFSSLLSALLTGELYWFIYAILLMYAAAPLFWEKEGRSDKRLLWIELIVFLLLFAFCCWFTLTGHTIPHILQLQNALLNFPFFLSGMMIRQNEEACLHLEKKARPFLYVFAAVCIALSVVLYRNTLQPLIYPVSTMLAYALMYLLWSGAKALPGSRSLLPSVSRYSLQIMLLDSFFKVLLFFLWMHLLSSHLIMIPLLTAMDVFFGCMVCTLCRKIPLIHTLLGL